MGPMGRRLLESEAVCMHRQDNVLRISGAADQSRGRIAPAIRPCPLHALVVPPGRASSRWRVEGGVTRKMAGLASRRWSPWRFITSQRPACDVRYGRLRLCALDTTACQSDRGSFSAHCRSPNASSCARPHWIPPGRRRCLCRPISLWGETQPLASSPLTGERER